jgi:4a-hydroxytetrahydrobiopterin dehydratase
MDWTTKRCVPCEAGTPRLAEAVVVAALRDLVGWEALQDGTRLHRRLRFKDFVEAMRFVNAMAGVAEAEAHHPDFAVHWNQVDVTLWTHVAGGLTENDFIVAAKLAALPEAGAAR